MSHTALTAKQEAFCQHYALHGNGAEAYRSAYNAKKASPQICAVRASELLKNSKITVRLAQLQAKVQAVAEEEFEITARRVLVELARISMADPAQAYGPDGKLLELHEMPESIRRAIASIDVDEIAVGKGGDRVVIGQTRKIKFWDKNTALTSLGKTRAIRLFVEQLETGKPGDFDDLTDEQLEAELAALDAITKAQRQAKGNKKKSTA